MDGEPGTVPRGRTKQGPEESSSQRAVYDAERAAALPRSDLGRELLDLDAGAVPLDRCVVYLRTIQQQQWFLAAFAGHSAPVVVIGGDGTSCADPERKLITIGDDDRADPRDCERACLHELAHIVTADLGPDRLMREPAGPESSRGHHHAWRANYVLIIRMMFGGQAAARLENEFRQWGLLMR